MTLFDQRRGPLAEREGLTGGRTTTDRTKGSRPTQIQRILYMLWESDEVCGSRFYRAYIPRFSAQIHRLRRAGYVITKRPCDIEAHDHEGTGWLYRLEALPFDPTDGE